MADRNVTVRVDLQAGQQPALTQQAQQLQQAQRQVAREQEQAALRQAVVTERMRQGGVGGMLQAAAGGLGGGVTGVMGALTGGLPGVGITVGALTALGGAAAQVGEAFRTVRDSAEALVAAQREMIADLNQARSTGIAGADALRRALTTAEQQQLAAAQQAGNRAAQLQILENAAQRHRLESVRIADAPGGAAGRIARLQADLEMVERGIRSTPGRLAGLLGIPGPTAEMQRQAAMRAAGVPELQMPSFTSGQADPAQIRAWALTAAGTAQAGAGTLRAVLRSGIIPSLDPFAPGLQQLPAFQSRQGDVLDLHAQIQQEVARDLRQRTEFEAQMELGREILTQLQRIGSLPGGAVGAVMAALADGVHVVDGALLLAEVVLDGVTDRLEGLDDDGQKAHPADGKADPQHDPPG